MPWVRFEDNFDEHQKIVGLTDAAFRLWIRATAYSARYLTDGLISRSVAKSLRPHDWARSAGQLTRAGLWEVVDGGYQVHDYHEYQPTKETVLEQRVKRAASGRIGGSKPKAKAKHVA